ncbi:hypothetical protein AB0I87_31840 [Streptomyces sp. NPDC049952]|uniref:hypothetical protein n=1 Tax=Streptomyces TaxID=1883 RepID=UPI00343B9552
MRGSSRRNQCPFVACVCNIAPPHYPLACPALGRQAASHTGCLDLLTGFVEFASGSVLFGDPVAR